MSSLRLKGNRADLIGFKPLPEVIAWAIWAGEDGRDPNALTEAVAHDPALALRTLALARECPPAGERAHLDLRQISGALSGAALHALVTRAAIDSLRGRSPWPGKVEFTAFWAHSLHCAYLARALADAAGYAHPEEAYLAGLLHDAGIAAQMAAVPDRYPPLVEGAVSETHLLQKEQETLAARHPEIGEWLAAQLDLPGRICDAVLMQHAAEGDLAGTHVLVRVLWVAEALSDPSSSFGDRERFAHVLGIDSLRLTRACDQALVQWQASTRKFGLANLPAATLWATPSLPSPESGSELTPGTSPRTLLLKSILEQAALQQTGLFLLESEDRHGILARARAISAAVFGLSDIAVFFYDGRKNALSGWLVDDERLTDAELRIPVSGGASAVARAWAERAPITSIPDRSQGLRGVDLQIARMLRAEGFVAAPLITGPSALGVIAFGVGREQTARILDERRMLLRLTDLVAATLARGRDAAEREQARQTNAIDRLTATVRSLVHEARNPLSILKTQLELVRERIRSGVQVDRDMQILGEEIDRVGGILTRLTTMDTRVEPAGTTVNVNRTIQDLLALYRDPLFAERGIAVKLELAIQGPEAVADADALKQVLVNLWKNASEAMVRGGQLRVATADRVNYEGRLMVEIAISDTGPGMLPDMLEGVFLQRGTQARAGDRGYGLANSYAVVRELGGHIMCRSQPGIGTTFTLLLPRAAREAVPPA